MRCSAAARLCRQMLHFASLTEILSLRYRLSVFLSRRKKNSEKERPLRGFRREVRFIMSPPGKRRHNELNAAPPPETPRRTGKLGEPNNRDVVQSGESFCIRAKVVCQLSARHDSAFAFPSRAAKQGRGNESVSGGDREPRLTEPQRDRCPKGG